MRDDLHGGAAATGLQLHPDKTKIIHNEHTTKPRRIPQHVNISGMTIEILPPSGSLKYLGRHLTFKEPHKTEIEHRIAAAWRKFHCLRQELTSPNYSLNDRLRLFHSTISATVLYGSEAWTMTQELEHRIRKTQRQMLRMIFHSPRRRHTINPQPQHMMTASPQHQPPTAPTATTLPTSPAPHTPIPSQNPHSPSNEDSTSDNDVDSNASAPKPDPPDLDSTECLEPWVDWIKRCTHEIETRLRNLRLEDWVTMQRRRKFRYARKILHTDEYEWNNRALNWDPTRDHKLTPQRRHGRPRTRWTDDLNLEHILDTTEDMYATIENKNVKTIIIE
jgi:hypothetical protein